MIKHARVLFVAILHVTMYTEHQTTVLSGILGK